MRSREQGFLLLPLLVLLALSLLLIQISATSLSQAARMQASKLDGERLQKQADLILQRLPLDALSGTMTPTTATTPCLEMAAGLIAQLDRQGCLRLLALPADSDWVALLDLQLAGKAGMRGHWQVLLANQPGTAQLHIQRVHDCLGPQRRDCQ